MQKLKSNPCKECHQKSNEQPSTLCAKCSVYADQDYVGGKENLTLGQGVENFEAEKALWPHATDEELDETSSESLPSFYNLLRRSCLSRREKWVLKLRFVEGLSFESIADRMRVGLPGISTQYYRAIKKLQEEKLAGLTFDARIIGRMQSLDKSEAAPCLPIRHFKPDGRGGLTLFKVYFLTPLDLKLTRSSKPHLLKDCPRCGAEVFCVDTDLQYCMDCLWNSDTDDVPRYATTNTHSSVQKQKGEL